MWHVPGINHELLGLQLSAEGREFSWAQIAKERWHLGEDEGEDKGQSEGEG